MQSSQVLVGTYLVCVPLLAVLIDRIGGHDVARIAQLVLGLMCALLYAADAGERTAKAGSRFGVLVGLIAMLGFTSILRSPDMVMAARELATFAGMGVIGLVSARLRDSMLAPSAVATIASATYVAVVMLVIAMSHQAGQVLNRAELFIGYDNYRFFNHTQTVALPLAVLAVTVASQRTWQRGVGWFAAVGGFALLFAIAGRGTIVGIAVGGLVIGVMFGRASLATLKNLAISAGLGLLLYWLLFWLMPQMMGAPPGFAADYYGNRVGSIEMRFYLWRIALSYIEQAPWLGIGPMHYAHIPTGDAAHPHNIYLQVAAEWGLPILVVAVILGLMALRKMISAVRQCPNVRERDCGVGLVLTCVAIAVDGLFSGNFVMPVSQVWIAFTFGWAAAWLARQHTTQLEVHPQAGKGRLFKGIVTLGLVASQLWLAGSVWPEVRKLDEHIRHAIERVPAATMNPRFWSHGWF